MRDSISFSDRVAVGEVLSGVVGFPPDVVYVVYDDDRPVYVGRTKRSLRRRLLEHLESSSLLGEALEISALTLGVRVVVEGDLDRIEVSLIRELRPEFNQWGLPPGARTGEARRVWEEREAKRKEWEELAEHRRAQFYRALGEFKRYVGEAEKQARFHIMHKTDDLGVGEEVDAEQIGREAFEVFLRVLREKERV